MLSVDGGSGLVNMRSGHGPSYSLVPRSKSRLRRAGNSHVASAGAADGPWRCEIASWIDTESRTVAPRWPALVRQSHRTILSADNHMQRMHTWIVISDTRSPFPIQTSWWTVHITSTSEALR
ncbi:hypothetical protein PENSPDRAFT_58426 [Peniophora sp. CONT]|nr:hypothetical protein PENSPDRAFT_58426 [Peniophora sp. CONT]